MNHRVYKPVSTAVQEKLNGVAHNTDTGASKLEDEDGRKNFNRNSQATRHVVKMLAIIESQQETKFLGVCIDEQLTWTSHCGQLTKILSSYLFVFRNLRTVLSIPHLVNVYYGHIESRLGYVYIHKNIFKYTTHASIDTYDTRYATDLAVPQSGIRMAVVNKLLVDMYNIFLRIYRNNEIHTMNVYQFSRFVKKCLLTECFYSEYDKQLVEKVTDSIVKTLERRIAHIEEKLEKIIKENSTVITDIKEEAAILKSENEFLLRKFDDIHQKGRCNSLRIFNLKESEGENLSNEVTQLINSKLGIKIKDGDIITCIRVGEKRGNRPRGVLLKLDNMDLRRNIYSKKKC
nr:unnamed protein product [Callosobruchus analis]